MADGLAANGMDVHYVADQPVPGVLARGSALLGRRPLMWHGVEREVGRHYARRTIPDTWDLLYAVPGLLPGSGPGARVLHQATRHPAVVAEAVAAAQRDAGGGRNFMTRGERRRYERELARADLIRTESVAVREELLERGVPEARVVHAYPGIDLERFQPGIEPREPLLAFIGTLSVWKGADIVAALARRLEGRMRVGVVGGPVCSWSVRVAAGAPLEPWSDVPELLRRSTALVLPSASDGFGYVVLEALASGCVPIVSPEVGSAEVVRRLHPDLVQPRATFVDGVEDLLARLPFDELAHRARGLAAEFERGERGAEAARVILQAMEQRSR
jgi:glycosyltransferase involved in cell wall biosynthesis